MAEQDFAETAASGLVLKVGQWIDAAPCDDDTKLLMLTLLVERLQQQVTRRRAA